MAIATDIFDHRQPWRAQQQRMTAATDA